MRARAPKDSTNNNGTTSVVVMTGELPTSASRRAWLAGAAASAHEYAASVWKEHVSLARAQGRTAAGRR
jgi:hypothetical protein